MLSIGDKFRRTGAFVIDVMIVKMFVQIILSVLLGLLANQLQSLGVNISLNDTMALPILIGLILAMILVFIILYIGYCALCYRLLGKSLGKYLLSVAVNQANRSDYLNHERQKIITLCATLGIMTVYQAIQLYAFDKEPSYSLKL